MSGKRRKFWGWGYEDQGLDDAESADLRRRVAESYGVSELESVAVPAVEDIELRPPRLKPPSALESLCRTDAYERLTHSYGKSFADSVRMFRREVPNPPTLIRCGSLASETR